MSDTQTLDPSALSDQPAPGQVSPGAAVPGKEAVAAAPSAGDDGAFSFDEVGPAMTPAGNLDMIMRIPVEVQVILGSATMVMSDLANISRGATIPLDQSVGEPVSVVVNGRVVARGEIVVLEEDSTRFGISLTEVVGV